MINQFFDKLKTDFIELKFENDNFKYVLNGIDLEDLAKILIANYKKNELKAQGSFFYLNKKVKYEVKSDVIEFEFGNIRDTIFFESYKVHFEFSEKILFEIYNSSTLKLVNKLLKDEYFIKKRGTEIILNPLLSIIFKFFYNSNFAMSIFDNEFQYISNYHLDLFCDVLQKKEKISITDLNRCNFALILNKERKAFIEEINKYVEDMQFKPMIIIGNDGIGKTVSLQLYSLIKSKYHKFYFDFKKMDKLKEQFKRYFGLQLMKAFIPIEDKNNEKIEEKEEKEEKEKKIKKEYLNEFNNYLNLMKKLLYYDLFNYQNFFKCLTFVLQNYEFKNKCVFILDQYQEEYKKINENDFNQFKSLVSRMNCKIIICCSMNDKSIKEEIFSNMDDENDFDFSFEEKNNEKKQETISIIDIKEDELLESKSKKKNYNFKEYLIFKNDVYSDEDNKNKINQDIAQIKNKQNKIEEDIEIGIKMDIKKTEIQKAQEKPDFEIKNTKMEILFDESDEEILQYIQNKETIPEQHEKKIYLNNLVSLQSLIEKKEDQSVVECLFYFNYFPKYYSRFIDFKNNNLTEKNEVLVEKFYKIQKEKIQFKIHKFYNKNYDDNRINIYKNLIKLRKTINKYRNNSLDFKKLKKYSKIFPFKYISISLYEYKINKNIIYFNNDFKNFKFIINFSFPFIEHVINKMIDEYENYDNIKICELSGSALGNALENKIRKNIVNNNYFQHKFEERAIWSTNILTKQIIDEKKKQMNNTCKKSSPLFKDNILLDDINGAKILNENFYYIKPENEINKLIDSVILFKRGETFIMIALQITIFKKNKDIKTFEVFQNYLIKTVKTKFETLYNIKIDSIYLWFILLNNQFKNEETCTILKEQKICYAFYSLENKCFYEKRNENRINDLVFFIREEAKIFPKKENLQLKFPNPDIIFILENKISSSLKLQKDIDYENIRKSVCKSYGLLLDDDLNETIVEFLKKNSKYKNPIEILYLFSISLNALQQYFKNIDNLFAIFKSKDILYLNYNFTLYKISQNKEKYSIQNIENLPVEFAFSFFYQKSNQLPENITIKDLPNIEKNNICFIFKYYYKGKRYIFKNRKTP